MKHFFCTSLSSAILIFTLISCSHSTNNSNNTTENEVENKPIVQAPTFNQDSAYSFVAAQVAFGSRVPNTKAHKACSNFLANELRRFGAEVIEQHAALVAYDNTLLQSVNIIGSYNSTAKNRILLLAHWDCRPYSDNDPNPANYHTPVMGADDGASGVGVLLEIARQIGQKSPTVGIDIIFLDAEDYGQPSFYKGEEKENSWCLGSQYWARNPHQSNYRARYGVLLDMVGASGATFPKERVSMTYAAHVVEKIWNKAQQLGYGNYFLNKEGGAITDDHLYVNEIIGIPCADIINYGDNGFASHWHTINDTMDNIDKQTLKAVGQTLLEVIYAEE